MSEKGKPLTNLELSFLNIIQNHKGLENAISGALFAEKLDVPDRKIREMFTHLLSDHLLPLASSDKKFQSGYFIPETKEEIEAFHQRFRKRGLTALTKSARIQKITTLQVATQITFEQYENNEKIPGIVESYQAFIELFQKHPKLYAEEIKAIAKMSAPIFVDREKLKKINQAAANLQELTSTNL